MPIKLISCDTTVKAKGNELKHMTDAQFHTCENEHLFCITYNKLGFHYGVEYTEIYSQARRHIVPLCELYAHTLPLFLKAFPQTTSFYLLPDNLEFLERNMKKQGYSQDEQEELLDESLKEIELCNEIMHPFFKEIYVVKDDNHEEIALLIKKQLTKERNQV